MLDGSRTESDDTQTFRYDDGTDTLLGAETRGETRSYGAEVWTDSNQDGRVDRLVEGPVTTGRTRQVYGVKNGGLDMLFQESLQEAAGGEVAGRSVNNTFTTTFYETDAQARSVSGYSVADGVSDDGYGNLTTNRTYQLMGSVNGEMKVMATVGDSFTQTLEGSTNRTVLATVYTYHPDAKVKGAEGEGYTLGTEMGISDPEHVWRDGWLAPRTVVRTYSDGSIERQVSQRFADGREEITVEHTSAAGVKAVTRTTRYADNREVTVYPDGSRLEKKTWNETDDAVATESKLFDKDGVLFKSDVTKVYPNGRTVIVHGDGTQEERTVRAEWNGKVVERTRSFTDGSSEETVAKRFTNGRVVITVTRTAADGRESVTKTTKEPDGRVIVVNPDGTMVETKTRVLSEGERYTERKVFAADGTLIDSSKTTVYLDGLTVIVRRDESRVEQRIEQQSDGSRRIRIEETSASGVVTLTETVEGINVDQTDSESTSVYNESGALVGIAERPRDESRVEQRIEQQSDGSRRIRIEETSASGVVTLTETVEGINVDQTDSESTSVYNESGALVGIAERPRDVVADPAVEPDLEVNEMELFWGGNVVAVGKAPTVVSEVNETYTGALAADGKVDAGEVVWVDADGDGAEDSAQSVLSGWNRGDMTQRYTVIGLEAKLESTLTTSVMRTPAGTTTDQVVRTDYRYDDKGRTVGATGKGEFVTHTRGYTEGVADPVSTGVVVGTLDQEYVVIQGQAKLSKSTNQTTNYAGYTQWGVVPSSLGMLGSIQVPTDAVNVVTGTSWTHNFYNATGALVRMTGGGDSRGTTRHTDGSVSLSVSNNTNTYRVVNGKGLLARSTSESDNYSGYTTLSATGLPSDAKNTTHQTTETQYVYDGTGRMVFAAGSGSGRTEGLVLKAVDINQDGSVDDDDRFDTNGDGQADAFRYEEVENISTFENEMDFVVVSGQAQQKEIRSMSTSYGGYERVGQNGLPVDPATVTRSLSVQTNWLDDNGLLQGAVRSAEGRTVSRVYQIRDVNGDGDLDVKDRVDKNGNGQIDGDEGYAYDEVKNISKTTSTDRFIMVLGQAQVDRSDTTTTDYSQYEYLDNTGTPIGAKMVTTNNSFIVNHYDDWGRLAHAEGSSRGETRSLVRQVTDQNGDGFIDIADRVDENGDSKVDDNDRFSTEDDDSLSLMEVTNVYRVVGGQAVVTQTTSVSTVYGGYSAVNDQGIPLEARSVTETTSVVNYTHNAQGQLVSATGGVTGKSVNGVVQAVDQNGDGRITEADRVDTNGIPGIDDEDGYKTERLDLKNTNSATNTYVILAGQAQVIRSVGESTENLGSRINDKKETVPASVTTTDTTTQYRFDNRGRVAGAVSTSAGTTREAVLTPRDLNGDKKINELDLVDTNKDTKINLKDDFDYKFVEAVTFSQSTTAHGVLWGQSIALSSQSSATQYSGYTTEVNGVPQDAATTTTSTSTTDFICNALGQLSGAQGTNQSRTLGLVMNVKDQNDDGLITPDQDRVDTNENGWIDPQDGYQSVGEYGITTSNGNITFAVLQGVAQTLVSITNSTSYSGYNKVDKSTGIPVDPVNETKTTNRMDYVYSKDGIQLAAMGTSSGKTTLMVQSNPDRNGDGNIDVNDLQVSDFQSNDSYGVLAGQLTSLKVFTEFTSEETTVQFGNDKKPDVRTTTSKTQSGFAPDGKGNLVPTVETFVESNVDYDYTQEGKLDSASGWDKTTTINSHVDGTKTLTKSDTVNTYGIFGTEAKVRRSATTTTTYTGFRSVDNNGIAQNPTTLTTGHSHVDYTYDERGVMLSATGGGGAETVVTNADGSQSITFSTTNNTYLVVWGQAVVDESVTESETYSGHTAVDADGVPTNAVHYAKNKTTMKNIYNNVGQLINATGRSEGHSWDKVWQQKDTNRNGVVDDGDDRSQGEWKTVYSVSEGQMLYAILWGQAVVVKNETNTWAANDQFQKIDVGQHNYSHTLSVIYSSYNMGGQLASAHGTAVTKSTLWVKTLMRDGQGPHCGRHR
jgi:hypothetical protein